MSRNLLHKTKLEGFMNWLTEQGIEYRAGRGEYQVIQVKTKNGQWQCVFDRLFANEHFTVARPIEYLVRQFIQGNKKPTISGGSLTVSCVNKKPNFNVSNEINYL